MENDQADEILDTVPKFEYDLLKENFNKLTEDYAELTSETKENTAENIKYGRDLFDKNRKWIKESFWKGFGWGVGLGLVVLFIALAS